MHPPNHISSDIDAITAYAHSRSLQVHSCTFTNYVYYPSSIVPYYRLETDQGLYVGSYHSIMQQLANVKSE